MTTDLFNKGTVTIDSPGHKLHGKKGHIFHKHEDGRVNVQIRQPGQKRDHTVNLTLKPGEFKMNEQTDKTFNSLEEADFSQSISSKNDAKYRAGHVPKGTVVKGSSYGAQYNTDEDGNEVASKVEPVKRGRGRPKKGTEATSAGKTFSWDMSGAKKGTWINPTIAPIPKRGVRKVLAKEDVDTVSDLVLNIIKEGNIFEYSVICEDEVIFSGVGVTESGILSSTERAIHHILEEEEVSEGQVNRVKDIISSLIK